MVFIPGGEFLRGRSHPLPDDDVKWRPTLLKDDRPAKMIYVDPFDLDAHEVTNEAYLRFLEATGRERPFHWIGGKITTGEEQHPVVNVNWHEATAYCESLGKRLPTEAEWERAARGMAEGAKFPWGEEEPKKGEHAHFNVLDGTRPVCQFPKNGFGLCDMAGNVWEWCFDRYDRMYYEKPPEKNPRGPEEGMYRMLRGGSWADAAKYLTSAYRSYARPRERSPNIGFRCAESFSQKR
jgi:formylglycine-generating enzyme required for sulfatase activity